METGMLDLVETQGVVDYLALVKGDLVTEFAVSGLSKRFLRIRTGLDESWGTSGKSLSVMIDEKGTATFEVVVELQDAWRDILKRAKLVQHHWITREELSVREYMSMVLKTLQGRRFVEFEELFEPEKGSTVLVVTFIALLELAKETLIEITQAEAFAPIYVRLAYRPAATTTSACSTGGSVSEPPTIAATQAASRY